ncbi:unnamed protein product [Acanthoscelides obtectus]|uniref:Uncharacterized protein n=1 Tax=Acanthoscelides obtectus TaxID=200917 RepID=A0A9P0PXK4_ACAOB|nr:unnamed protein product [Acanthoscelides obtectus]CAK1651484.1 hypothetical protein AOBTE_LOCUS17317 [Acanthoscelides obtectus]
MYCMDWYQGTASEMRTVQFMIARSQVVCIIPAILFGRYEYALFIRIIKTAYSYVTVMGS